MAGRIVLFGATGYTGRLTAKALVERGARPVLAGRNRAALEELAAALGPDLEVGTADVGRPATVGALRGGDDVLLSTVGPFTKWGDPAVEAAIDAGAVAYLDSTGEPPFIRRVFEEFGPAAAEAGVPLLTAMGYDWVPGNLAAALALAEAGEAATAVEIGYFMTGGGGFSGGTMASVVASLLEPGFAYRDGRLVTEANGKRVRSFEVRGRSRQAVSASSSEHFAIPAQFPRVRTVEPYLGWFGSASRPLQAGSYAIAGITRVPGAKAALERVLGRFAKGSTGGPSEEERAGSGSHIVAAARSSSGEQLSEVRLEGLDGYTFTANMLAWASTRALEGGVDGVGALGPAQAFGVEGLEAGVAEAGINRS